MASSTPVDAKRRHYGANTPVSTWDAYCIVSGLFRDHLRATRLSSFKRREPLILFAHALHKLTQKIAHGVPRIFGISARDDGTRFPESISGELTHMRRSSLPRSTAPPPTGFFKENRIFALLRGYVAPALRHFSDIKAR